MTHRKLLALLAVLAALSSAQCTTIKRHLYERGDRDEWQHPERVIQSLAIQPGQYVADIGAGGGYFTFRLADALGPEGKLYAADVDSGMIDYLETRAAEEGYANVVAVLGEYDDPLLPGAVNLIFTCNTYHHIEDRVAYFTRAKRYLRPGGRVAIVEYKPMGWFQKIFGHYTPGDVIRAEMANAGYELQHEHTFLSKQSFLVFVDEID